MLAAAPKLRRAGSQALSPGDRVLLPPAPHPTPHTHPPLPQFLGLLAQSWAGGGNSTDLSQCFRKADRGFLPTPHSARGPRGAGVGLLGEVPGVSLSQTECAETRTHWTGGQTDRP